MGLLQILKNWLLFLWFTFLVQLEVVSLWNIHLESEIKVALWGEKRVLVRKAQPAEWEMCVFLSNPDSQSWKQALCRNRETILCATHRRLSSTPKCGCLCHFNWSVFVKWGLYLLIAWGLCLPSLVEAKWQGSCKLSRCILRHFSFQYQSCLIRELLWSKRRRVQGLQGGITPNYSNNC